MLYLTCTMISSVGLAHYGGSHSKDWVSVDCGSRLTDYPDMTIEVYHVCKQHTITLDNDQ